VDERKRSLHSLRLWPGVKKKNKEERKVRNARKGWSRAGIELKKKRKVAKGKRGPKKNPAEKREAVAPIGGGKGKVATLEEKKAPDCVSGKRDKKILRSKVRGLYRGEELNTQLGGMPRGQDRQKIPSGPGRRSGHSRPSGNGKPRDG